MSTTTSAATIVLRDACEALGIGYGTLKKYLGLLSITPARHPLDPRFHTITEEELAQLRDTLAQRPIALPAAPRSRRQQQPILRPPAAAPVPTRTRPSSESPLNANLGQLPGDLVTLEAFALLHHVAVQTAKKALRLDDPSKARLTAVTGSWKVRCGHAKYALDAAGRARFYELWHDSPHFHRCPDCPHMPSEDQDLPRAP